MPVSCKSKKYLKHSKKTRKYIKKMRGGGGIIKDPGKGEYYNVENSDVKIVMSEKENDSYYLKHKFFQKNKLCKYIKSSNGELDINNVPDELFKKAQATENIDDKNKILDEIYKIRKTNIEKEKLIKLPNGVFFRTPLIYKNNELKFLKCSEKFKLPLFEVKDEFLYLYKVIPISHLEMIARNGLHSKYGGTGGLSREQEVQFHDRGKMYVSPNNKLSFYSERIQERDVMITIKIPVEDSYTINLAANFDNNGYMDIFFIGQISNKNIEIELGENKTKYKLSVLLDPSINDINLKNAIKYLNQK